VPGTVFAEANSVPKTAKIRFSLAPGGTVFATANSVPKTACLQN
tara:strand:+ start:510 stop:641 length:132 start_codon:yes stop_codon:yes gene_type:complete